MGAPAFQHLGTQFASSGAFGSAPFGTSPFGGADQDVFEIPSLHVSSDNPSGATRETVGEVKHYRDGLLVGARTTGFQRFYRCVMRVKTMEEAEALRPYWKARRFYFLPEGNPAAPKETVFWEDENFNPEPTPSGNRFGLEFTLRVVG